MKHKIKGIVLITIFAIFVLPMTVSAGQTVSPIKVSNEIDPETISMFSDLTNTVLDQSNSNNNPITAQARPDKPDKPGKPRPDPTPEPTPESYALTIEIDYIEGHEPTQYVLDYMVEYYAEENIALTFVINDVIPLDESLEDGVSNAEFWALEAEYNDGADKADNNPTFELTTLNEKWVLYGTSVENEPFVVGYTLCWGSSRDLVSGNWMYIADGTGDSLTLDSDLQMGIEAVVLMHEFGHSIGICTIRVGGEVYCRDVYCVMATVTSQNAGNFGNWYYCRNHWKTKNINYYVV